MTLRRIALSVAVSALLALPAWAQEAVDKAIDVTEPVVDGAHVKAGVPQFDPSSFAGQLFWLAVSFALLYMLMAKLALPRIGRVVEGRAHQIAADLQQAQADRDAAAAALATYEANLVAARSEAQTLIAQAQATANQTQSIALSAQGNKIAGDIHAAEQRIAAARQQAIGQIAPVAAGAASAMLQKIARLSPDQAKVEAAVATALKNKAA